MTNAEFKAWFDGFTENLDRVPTKAQWARIRERVAEIDGKTVTERVFVDRYWPLYTHLYPYWHPYYPPYYGGICTAQSQNYQGLGVSLQQAGQNYQNLNSATQYNSLNAMQSLGQNEMKLINA